MLSSKDFPILKSIPFESLSRKQQLSIMRTALFKDGYRHEWDKPMTIESVLDAYKGYCPNGDRLFYRSFFIRYPQLTEVPWETVLFNLPEIIVAVEKERGMGNKGYNSHNERALVLYFSLVSIKEKQVIDLIPDTDYYRYIMTRLDHQGVLSITDMDAKGKIFSIICSRLGKKVTISGRRRRDLEGEYYSANK